MDKSDREIQRSVRKACAALIKLIESEPRVVELEFDGSKQGHGQAGTLRDIGSWLFHRR